MGMRMKDFSKLQVFSHGFLQDALTLMKVMERESLGQDDIREYLACLFNGKLKKKESGESPKRKGKKNSQTSGGAKEGPDPK